jgi:hypothetical protein
MNKSTIALRVLLVWIALVLVQIGSGMIVQERSSAGNNALPWFLLSNLIVAVVLCFLAFRSGWRGVRLALALSAIPLVINLANDIDGIVFLTSSGIEWKKEILRLFLASALSVPFWMLIFAGRAERPKFNYCPFKSKPPMERLWRFVVSDIAYYVFYLAAGTTVWFTSSQLRDFYATQTIPPAGKLLALQLFVRGPLYVGVCLLMARMTGLPGKLSAAALGMAFAALNGVALLVPNQVFPDAVRWAHFYEVVSSSFLFGLFVAWMWREKRTGASRIMKQAA